MATKNRIKAKEKIAGASDWIAEVDATLIVSW
jgi:hypothetical protein